jgi:hypothetical protein
VTLETYIRAQLVRFSAEQGARYGGVNNMLAVAFALRNRVFAGWGGWLDVIERAPGRLANPDMQRPELISTLRSGTGRVLLARVDEIYSRTDAEDLTGGGLFWVDPQQPIAPWFKKEVIERPAEHPRVAHVGPVWFFQ